MAEETVATSQPDVTTTEAPETPYVPSFLRDEGESEPSTDETPETQTEEGEPEPEAEQEAASDEQAEPTGADESAESADDFIATLTLKERAEYARRYPSAWRALTDPGQPEDLRALLADKIKSDFDIQERIRAEQEPTLPEEEEEVAATVAPDIAEQRKQYYAQIDDIVAHQIDPQAVNEMGSQLLAAMGVPLDSKDPEIAAIVRNAPKVGQVLARGAIDLMSTVIPKLLPTYMETGGYKKFNKMYYRAMYNDVWEETRNKSIPGPDGKPTTPYSKLPAYGSEQFRAALDKAMNEIPGLEEMTYRDKYGNVLEPEEQAARKYALVAKMMTGQQINPAAMAQAVETGKKLARSADTRRAAGKVLGAGKTTGDVKPGGSSNDDIFGPGVEEYRRRGG